MPVPRPQGTSVRGAAVVASTGARATERPILPVSVDTVNGRASRLRDKRERIQICGDANAGKTFAWLTQAAVEQSKAEAEGVRIPQFFCLDTDDTMPAMLEPGGDFHGLYKGDGGNVSVYPCDVWGDVVGSLQTILRQAERGDYIVFDVVNQAYDLAVAEVAKPFGIDVASETFRRIQTKEGFGAFPSEIWQAVSVIFDAAIRRVVTSPAHVLFIQHLADYVEQRANREVVLMYDQVGVKPQGAKKISRVANTIIFLQTIRVIPKDNRTGKRDRQRSTEIVRKMTILKDRGKMAFADLVYDDLLFAKLEEARVSGKLNTTNITEPARASSIVADALARIRKTESDEVPDAEPTEYTETQDPESLDQ